MEEQPEQMVEMELAAHIQQVVMDIMLDGVWEVVQEVIKLYHMLVLAMITMRMAAVAAVIPEAQGLQRMIKAAAAVVPIKVELIQAGQQLNTLVQEK